MNFDNWLSGYKIKDFPQAWLFRPLVDGTNEHYKYLGTGES